MATSFSLHPQYSKIYHQCWTIGQSNAISKALGLKFHDSQLKIINALPRNIHVETIQHGKNDSLYILCKDNRMFITGSNKNGALGTSSKYIPNLIQKIIEQWFNKTKIVNNFPTDMITIIKQYINKIEMENESLIPIHISNNIDVKYISRGIDSIHRFIISKANDIYFTGQNTNKQLGIAYPNEIKQWTLCNNILDNIKYIETTETFTVVLKNNGKVFSTWQKEYYNTFKQIKSLKYQFIVSISCGESHCLLLNNRGCVYSFGTDGIFGQLGRNDQFRDRLIQVKFQENEIIKIIKIKCGNYHNLCLDNSGDVYSFGQNTKYQCGTGMYSLMCDKPYLIRKLEGIEIIDIKCGMYHSMVKSIDNKYYLWGSNDKFECLVFEDRSRSIISDIVGKKSVIEPIMYDPEIYFGTNYEIVDMYLGCNTTKIVTRVVVPFLRMYQICKSETLI